MSFTRPALKTIINRIKADYKSGLSLKAILRRSFLDVMSKTYGGASHTLHGHIDFAINKKFFPLEGDEETVVRWGTLYNLPRKEATFTELIVDVVGTTGATLPEDRVYVRSDGIEYKVKADVIIPAATTVSATLVSQSEGDIGNMEVGEMLSIQSPLPGIESDVTVTLVAVEGEDLEDLELYRARVLARLQQPPAGGKATDYIAFALSVAGVTRAWVLPGNLGEGTVGVTFVEDDEVPIIPDAAKVAEVQLVLNEEAPVPADSTAFAPITFPMNPQIQLKPNTAAVQAAVISELEDMLAREAQVRDGLDPEQVGLAVIFDGKIPISKINEAISIAADEDDHVLLFPTADVQPSTGGLVVLGTPVFTPLP